MADRATVIIGRSRGPDAAGEGGDAFSPAERAMIRAELAAYPFLTVGVLAAFALLWIATP